MLVHKIFSFPLYSTDASSRSFFFFFFFFFFLRLLFLLILLQLQRLLCIFSASMARRKKEGEGEGEEAMAENGVSDTASLKVAPIDENLVEALANAEENGGDVLFDLIDGELCEVETVEG